MHRKLYSIPNALVKGRAAVIGLSKSGGGGTLEPYNHETSGPEGHLNHETFFFMKKALEAYNHGTSALEGVLMP